MINRRTFMLRSAVLAASPLMAQTSAYAVPFEPLHDPYLSLSLLFDDLFPAAPGVPTPKALNSIGYLRGVMDDAWIPRSEKRFVRNGVTWLHEESIARFGKKYYLLDARQRQETLQSISQVRWGDNWLYTLMNYLFESMFCDPLYGANTDGAGWRWLSHEPGYPRPKEASL